MTNASKMFVFAALALAVCTCGACTDDSSGTTPTSGSTVAADALASNQQRCQQFAPTDYPVLFAAKSVTVADLRSIVIGTLPPTPTTLLLTDHASAERALMCWTSNGSLDYVQYWVTVDGESRVLCSTRVQEPVPAGQTGRITCI